MKFLFIIVGCGGIGGNVIRDIPKLLHNTSHKMILIDGDHVEETNCVRQPFQNQDVGFNKARVLAKKINSFYTCGCLFHDDYIVNEELDMIISKNVGYTPFFIGAVDNDNTRILIEEAYLKCEDAVYIDGANSEFEGNVYISYIYDKVRFGKIRSDVYLLENDINPGLVGCEESIAKGSVQYMITNNKVSTSILEHIYPFLINELSSAELYEGVSDIVRFNEVYIK